MTPYNRNKKSAILTNLLELVLDDQQGSWVNVGDDNASPRFSPLNMDHSSAGWDSYDATVDLPDGYMLGVDVQLINITAENLILIPTLNILKVKLEINTRFVFLSNDYYVYHPLN